MQEINVLPAFAWDDVLLVLFLVLSVGFDLRQRHTLQHAKRSDHIWYEKPQKDCVGSIADDGKRNVGLEMKKLVGSSLL